MHLSQIPGYARAEARASKLEDSWRELAFVAVPERICGIAVRQLTLRAWLELCALRSPFLCGGTVHGHDVALFLWRMSPEFSRTDSAARSRFFAAVGQLDFERTQRGIKRFVDRMIIDRPPSCTGASGSASTSDTSFAAWLIHRIASAYSWERDTILDLAMPELFQYLREIQREKNPKLPHFNPIRARLTKKIVERQLALEREKAIAEAAVVASAVSAEKEAPDEQ